MITRLSGAGRTTRWTKKVRGGGNLQQAVAAPASWSSRWRMGALALPSEHPQLVGEAPRLGRRRVVRVLMGAPLQLAAQFGGPSKGLGRTGTCGGRRRRSASTRSTRTCGVRCRTTPNAWRDAAPPTVSPLSNSQSAIACRRCATAWLPDSARGRKVVDRPLGRWQRAEQAAAKNPRSPPVRPSKRSSTWPTFAVRQMKT